MDRVCETKRRKSITTQAGSSTSPQCFQNTGWGERSRVHVAGVPTFGRCHARTYEHQSADSMVFAFPTVRDVYIQAIGEDELLLREW